MNSPHTALPTLCPACLDDALDAVAADDELSPHNRALHCSHTGTLAVLLVADRAIRQWTLAGPMGRDDADRAAALMPARRRPRRAN